MSTSGPGEPRNRESVAAPGPPIGDGAIDGISNLDADEALLRLGQRGARVGHLSSEIVSYGVGQSEQEPWAQRARRLGLPIVRRRSGGSGVLHGPGDLTWTIVLPRGDPDAGRDFVAAYPRLGQGVVRWLGDLGLTATWSEPFGLSSTFCLLGDRGKVLTVRGRVIGGAAQHLTARALLHHGTVLYRVDRPRVAQLFEIPEPTLHRSLTSLTEEGVAGSPQELSVALLRRVRESVA